MLWLQDLEKREVQTHSPYALSWCKSPDVTAEEKRQELWEEGTTEVRRVMILMTVLRSHIPPAAAHVSRIGSERDFWVHTAALGQCKHKINSAITIHGSQSPSSHLQDQQWVLIQFSDAVSSLCQAPKNLTYADLGQFGPLVAYERSSAIRDFL